MSGRQAPARLLVAGITLVALALVLALGVWLTMPPANARAASWLNPTPTATAATAATRGNTEIPCLVVTTSGCPQTSGAAPISVQAPGTVAVVGANWTPSAMVSVLLVPAAQPCTASPAGSAQARASAAGVFSVALRLPASATNGTLYGLCAATADGKQTFPAAGLAATSPLRLRIVRTLPPAAPAPAPAPPIDGFSLAALVLAALSAGVFVFSRLHGQHAKVSADR